MSRKGGGGGEWSWKKNQEVRTPQRRDHARDEVGEGEVLPVEVAGLVRMLREYYSLKQLLHGLRVHTGRNVHYASMRVQHLCSK